MLGALKNLLSLEVRGKLATDSIHSNQEAVHALGKAIVAAASLDVEASWKYLGCSTSLLTKSVVQIFGTCLAPVWIDGVLNPKEEPKETPPPQQVPENPVAQSENRPLLNFFVSPSSSAMNSGRTQFEYTPATSPFMPPLSLQNLAHEVESNVETYQKSSEERAKQLEKALRSNATPGPISDPHLNYNLETVDLDRIDDVDFDHMSQPVSPRASLDTDIGCMVVSTDKSSKQDEVMMLFKEERDQAMAVIAALRSELQRQKQIDTLNTNSGISKFIKKAASSSKSGSPDAMLRSSQFILVDPSPSSSPGLQPTSPPSLVSRPASPPGVDRSRNSSPTSLDGDLLIVTASQFSTLPEVDSTDTTQGSPRSDGSDESWELTSPHQSPVVGPQSQPPGVSPLN